MESQTNIHAETTSNLLKDAVPSYLGFLFSIHFPSFSPLSILSMISVVAVVFLIIYIIYKYFQFKQQLLQNYVILEIKPPSIALQSAFSTKQLFTIFYSLDHDTPFIERFLKVKRTISYELVSTREEGIRYIFHVPEEDVPIIKKNLLSYLPGVIITEIDDYLPENVEELQMKQFSLYELKLGKSYILPLQEQNMLKDVDPIAYITGQMTKQEPDELISIQVVTTPVTCRFHSNIMEHIHMLNKRIYEGKEIVSHTKADNLTGIVKIVKTIITLSFTVIFGIAKALADWLMDIVMSSKNPQSQQVRIYDNRSKDEIKELSPKQKYVQEMVERKINQNLFETTIRLLVIGSNKENVTLRRKGITSSFSTFSQPGYQTLQAKNILPFTHSLLTKLNYLKLNYRLLSSTSPILSATELSSIYHFPYTTTTQTEDIQSVKSSQLPAPISLKNANGSLDVIFAHNIHGDSITPIGLTLDERRRHIYIIGATGMGKSTMILHMIHHDMESGRGMAIIDPHGDLAKTVISTVPESRTQDVVYINPTDRNFPIGLNIFDMPEGLTDDEKDQEKDMIVSTIISVFHKLFTDQYVKHRMEHILRNTILTALEQENPTFLTIKKLLTDTKYRNEAKKKVTDEMVLDFWKTEFEPLTVSERTKVISPITNKLGVFLTNKTVRYMITQNKSTINFDEIMSTHKILVCNFSMGEIGEDMSSFLGNLVIAKIQLAAMRRSHIPMEERKDFFLYVDEFQNFATHTFAQILSEARKYRLGAVLAHQTISQIEDKALQDTIIGNSGTVVVFRTGSPKDEETMLSYLSPQVQKGQIGSLSKLTFYIKINAEDHQDPFTGRVELFLNKVSPEIEQNVIKHSQTQYGTPRELLQKEEVKSEEHDKSQVKEPEKKDDNGRSSM